MHHLVLYLLARRRLAWTILVTLLLAALAGLARLSFDNTPDAFFLKADRSLRTYQQFKRDFGSDEYTFIVLEAPSAWNVDFIGRVRELGAAVARLPDVRRVTSITSARFVEGSAGTLAVGEFIGEPLDDAALAARREVALRHPFYRDFLVSGNGRYLGILAETAVKPNEIAYKIQLTDRLRALLAQPAYRSLAPRLVGAPVIDRDVFFIVNIESLMFGALSFVIVAFGFYAMFRSWLAALLPLVVASLSILVAFGFMGWAGAPLGMLTPIIPSFLVAVGVASTVFLLSEVYQQRIAGRSLSEALHRGIVHTATTSGISVGTTAAALFTFAASDVKPAQDVGLAAGIGLVASYAFAFLLVPLVLGRRGDLEVSARTAAILNGRVLMMERLAGWVTGQWKLLLYVLAGLLAVAGCGLAQLRTDYHYVGLFKPSTEIRRSYEHVDNALRGGAGFEVVFDLAGAADGAATSPEVLQAVREFQTRIEQRFPALGVKTYSLADVVMEVNQAVNEGRPEHYRVPHEPGGVAQALLLFESSGNGEIERLLSADGNKLRVNVRARYRPDSEYRPLLADVTRYADLERPAALRDAQVEVTGVVALWSRLTQYLTRTQIMTTGLSVLVVLAAMAFVFRSVQMALVMAACNLVPVALVLAVMGWLDIFLDPFTILISTIAIGVLDDDTIHFVRRVLQQYRIEGDMTMALTRAYGSTGQAMLILATVLVAGFLVYTPSQVASLTKFGAITALAIGLGALCEFFFTPAVLMACSRFGLLRSLPPGVPAAARG